MVLALLLRTGLGDVLEYEFLRSPATEEDKGGPEPTAIKMRYETCCSCLLTGGEYRLVVYNV